MAMASEMAEYFGLFHEFTPLWCRTNQYDYEHVCGDAAGLAANTTYLASLGIDRGTDATNPDSDGDGMPDGWKLNTGDGLVHIYWFQQLDNGS